MTNEIRKLQLRISKLQQILDVLRKLLGLTTQLEKLEMEQMVRRVAKEEGVDPDLIAAVIWCESGMNPRAIKRNPNGTTDYGLCQFNDYWYRHIIDPGTALNRPEKAVRVMCQQFRAGHKADWICFRSAKYRKYLNV